MIELTRQAVSAGVSSSNLSVISLSLSDISRSSVMSVTFSKLQKSVSSQCSRSISLRESEVLLFLGGGVDVASGFRLFTISVWIASLVVILA